MISQHEIQKVCDETGMGELQAYRHLQARKILQRRFASERRQGSRRG